MQNFEKLFPSVASTHFKELWKCLLIEIFGSQLIQVPVWNAELQTLHQVVYEWKGNSSPGAVTFFVSVKRFLIKPLTKKGPMKRELRCKEEFARTSAKDRGLNTLFCLTTNPSGAFPVSCCVISSSLLHYRSSLHYYNTALNSYGFREGETLVHGKSLKEEFV